MAKPIEVSGFRAPASAPTRERRRARVRLVRPRNMIWLAVIASLPVIAVVWGTPHLRMTATYRGPIDRPFYVSCLYVGLHQRMIYPADGQCPVFRMFKDD